jgi:Holliday junction resolvase RusA-like endonuclease
MKKTKKLKIKYEDTPPSTQHIYGYVAYGRHKLNKFMTKKARTFKEGFLASIKEQLPEKFVPFSGDLEVKYFLVFSTKHKHDIDNYCKIVLDSLNGIVWEDDSQIKKLFIEKKYVKGKKEVSLEVKKLK